MWKEICMNIRKSGISFRHVVSLIAIASFLIVSQGAMIAASAAEWELWPKGRGKEGPTAVETKEGETPEAAAAAKEGGQAGKTVAAGTKAGTVGYVVLIAAGAVGVGLALSGGGGTTTPAHH